MKRFFRPISLILVLGMLSTPVIEARGRQGQGGNGKVENSSSSRHSQGNNNRPGTNNRPSNSNNRPGNQQGNNNRPSNNNNRPGNPQGSNNRPGNNNNRPGNPGINNRPMNPRPGNNRPVNARPGGPEHFRPDYYRPRISRPLMPANRPFTRPTPPLPSYRYGRPSLFNTLFGLTLGTALNISLDYLIDWGYNVAGYANNAIYLTDVSQLGYTWPNATLYYNNGVMNGSELVYSTPQYDLTRYNVIYNNLLNQYGQPVSQNNANNTLSATWWGNNEYVTLSYYSDYANNGSLRYYTTVTCGN